MDKETVIERTMYVEASPKTIWRALTEPELTKLYMDGWMIRTNWKRGRPVMWEERVGNDVVQRAKGTLMASLPAHRLRFTQLALDSGLPDTPDSYTMVDISMEEEPDGRTLVKLWHGDFAGLPNDVRRAREAGRRWVEALVGLKRVAEEEEGPRAA
ncbi:MAG: SRPBCC domain-containing protein [Flavobacteriales bacterium]|nr:SRPBCC domain-containing protein [Flavobacteriales bacterium]